MDKKFLSLAEIILIHENQINAYGGSSGIRDINLLSSAIAMPEAQFSGQYLHNDIYEMAAAYIFHITQNHPFVDGNKRTALTSGLVFLDLNNIDINDPHEILYEMMINVASGKLNKGEISITLKKLSEA
ncbi:MAG: type II toxin-antitoxin system death-on-curing family toxin [Leptospirales bacterium]